MKTGLEVIVVIQAFEEGLSLGMLKQTGYLLGLGIAWSAVQQDLVIRREAVVTMVF